MVQITIHCPECHKRGKIEIAENIVGESARGVTAVNVAEFLICSHSFIAYIDKNLAVRDCMVTDFKIELPQMDFAEELEADIPGVELVDIYLLTINIPPQALAYIIHACFFKKPILYLNDLEVVNTHLVNFFEFIFGDFFEVKIFLSTRQGYKKNKKQFKNYIVIDNNKVINDKEKVMNKKNMKIENALVQKFFSELDTKSSLIIIKNEIKKAYELSLNLIELNNSLEENELLSSKRAIDYLNGIYGIDVPLPYLELLMDVIENYFDIQLNRETDVGDFLGFI